MKPLLSVLLLVLNSRNWRPLQKHLTALQQKLRTPSSVEILIEGDNGALASGVKRQRLVNKAKGKYLCFVDDDDWVSNEYLSRILTGCRSGADVVTFVMETFPKNGFYRNRPLKKEFWRLGLYPDHRMVGLMAANHLCAWKSSLARRVGWCPYLGYGDDQLWYKPLMASGLVETSYHISKPLYHYNLDLNASVNQSRVKRIFAKNYVADGLDCFWMEDDIVVEVRSNRVNGLIKVINPQGKEIIVELEKLERFARVQI